ncbi:putative F-box/LRR-repeat protein At1g56400 [Magnolia sinica]|uniref:putative F-box/LRR-repeat protein At1g56400 n=1 Tax=Magnolia sinica TaxID=86752 RepID=UPI00265B29FB|nr:putative F-box/LRR-repeat protein At1g56400 [Magnolia sinica]
MDDTFSNLPEALLILIISFLPLKDAVMTSVLSKRWLNLWTNTMAIDLNEDQFLEIQRQRRLLGSGRKSWALHIKNQGRRRFAEFICQMLPCFEGPKISKFSLRFSYQTEYHYCMEEWIQFSISKKVEEIHLDLSDGDLPPNTTAFFESLFCLPDFLYAYKSLCVLNLDSCKFSPSNFQCFMTLRSLSLRRIKLPQEVIEDVIANSPFLINLSLIECFDLYYLSVSGVRLPLKKLIVRDCMPLSLGIEIYAPELQSFEYFGSMVTFYLENLVSLSNVILDFGLESKFYYYGVELSDLLHEFNHAKGLTVCSYLIQMLVQDVI